MSQKTLEGNTTANLTKYIVSSYQKKKKNEKISLKHIRIGMCTQFTEFKTLLQAFSLEEEIDEINDMIRSLSNKKLIASIKDRRYDRT